MSHDMSPPTTPPALDQRLDISADQEQTIQEILTALSVDLESIPIIFSQDGEVLSYAGAIARTNAEQLARQALRLWVEGADRPAREVLHFEEQIFSEATERLSFMLYSAHVEGAATLTVAWQLNNVSLTQLREEVADVLKRVRTVLQEG